MKRTCDSVTPMRSHHAFINFPSEVDILSLNETVCLSMPLSHKTLRIIGWRSWQVSRGASASVRAP
eukprot:CAMPEP_0206633628 /NCGR_PEP_ID=MMETSP0325_2-20121206/69598_1 /ASSEMBLY_ACC=CAM_ASM_000347 /TAXON_ID=2866 /ORGANISM="Crypthecodinium cohnii, Strain Seligo" /LENGTH=65 /DNA_ID=CAMNT_0054159347 /DNA_START=610 /DNA_END=803 /DNA_ORIENTATION=+